MDMNLLNFNVLSREESLEAESELSDFGRRMMLAEDRRVTLRNLKLMAVMAAGLVCFFALLDPFAYPEHVPLFAALRWTCASFMMILLLVVRSRPGRRYYQFFTIALPLIPAFFIAITIYVTHDPATIYYAGLSVCIVAIGFLFHWTYKEAFAVSGLILLMYLIACAPVIANGLTAKTGAGLFSNLIFLIATGTAVVAGSYSHHKVRVEEFRGRMHLRRQKLALRAYANELQQTLNELKATESQLIQSGKMASLGQLSAGVIHEIANPLNHSNQALFVLRKRLQQFPEDAIISDTVTDLQDSIERMKEIVCELREFSHKRGENSGHFPISDAIDVALKMLSSELETHGVEIVLKIDRTLLVSGVKNKLTQVFINVIHNAIQAMAGSDLTIEKRIEIATVTNGSNIVISIRDNGPGIPDPVLKEIFDPFFTTKDAGVGTGLGLSICFRIIGSHRGTIEARSDGESYTEFLISLPSAPQTDPALAQGASLSVNTAVEQDTQPPVSSIPSS